MMAYINTPNGPVELPKQRFDPPGYDPSAKEEVLPGFGLLPSAKPDFSVPDPPPPAYKPEPLVPTDHGPSRGSGAFLTPGEAATALADFRAHGVAEDKIAEAMGADYVAPAGAAATSAGPAYD